MSDQPSIFEAVQVTKEISFIDLFGINEAAMSDEVRRRRWIKWKAMAGPQAAQWWTRDNACIGCKHLDGQWCTLQGLPASVNPILSFREGLPGMACMGAGYEVKS